jgi:hypothetical protein
MSERHHVALIDGSLSDCLPKQIHNVDRNQNKPRNLPPVRRAWPLVVCALARPPHALQPFG